MTIYISHMVAQSSETQEPVLQEGGVPSSSVTVVDKKTIALNPGMQELVKQSVVLYLRSNETFLRSILKDFLMNNPHILTEIVEELNDIKAVELVSLDRPTAKAKIRKFIEANPGSRTSDIILATNLEPELVMEMLKELRTEGNVKSKPIE